MEYIVKPHKHGLAIYSWAWDLDYQFIHPEETGYLAFYVYCEIYCFKGDLIDEQSSDGFLVEFDPRFNLRAFKAELERFIKDNFKEVVNEQI